VSGPPRSALEFINKLRSTYGPADSRESTISADESELRKTLAHKDDSEHKATRGAAQVHANKVADKLRKERRGY
jgi:hypothetical protein